MWFALFWLKPLREFWRRELGEKYFLKLREVIPYTWLLDPIPLPQHAVIPRLELHDWRDPSTIEKMTDGELFWVISYGRGKMVGGEADRSPEKMRWKLVNLVRSFGKKGAGTAAAADKPKTEPQP